MSFTGILKVILFFGITSKSVPQLCSTNIVGGRGIDFAKHFFADHTAQWSAGSSDAANTLHQQAMSQHPTFWLLLICGIVLLLLAVIIVSFLYTRRIRRLNKVLSMTHDLAGRDTLPETDTNSTQVSQPDAEQADSHSGNDLLQPTPPYIDNRQLYEMMDRIVTNERLFLQPDLSREDLMELIHVGKNRFGRIMTQYCNSSNASTYISAKRAEYAAQLIRLHPNYTLSAIADMSGFSSTVTFNRAFKSCFGITPSEYRSNLGTAVPEEQEEAKEEEQEE